MPFVSKAQQRWAFATHQPFAKKWAAMTDETTLVNRAAKKMTRKRRRTHGR